MNINSNFIDRLNGMTDYSQDYFANVGNRVIINLQKLTPYLRYNQLTQAASIQAVNVGLIYLSDKLMEIASSYFKFNHRQGIRKEGAKCFLKGVFALGGVNGFNSIMNMQLSQLYLVSSVVFTIAAQIIWQKHVQPALHDSRSRVKKTLQEVEKEEEIEVLTETEELIEDKTDVDAELEDAAKLDQEEMLESETIDAEKEDFDLDKLLPKHNAVYAQVAKNTGYLGNKEANSLLASRLLEETLEDMGKIEEL